MIREIAKHLRGIAMECLLRAATAIAPCGSKQDLADILLPFYKREIARIQNGE